MLERRGLPRQTVGFEVATMEAKQPIKVFRAGRLACAIWEKETLIEGVSKSVLKATVSKRYKTRFGHWRSSFSFSSEEISAVIELLKEAFEAMVDMQIDHEIAQAIEAKSTEPLRLGVKRSAA